jgi:hypothetical protein
VPGPCLAVEFDGERRIRCLLPVAKSGDRRLDRSVDQALRQVARYGVPPPRSHNRDLPFEWEREGSFSSVGSSSGGGVSWRPAPGRDRPLALEGKIHLSRAGAGSWSFSIDGAGERVEGRLEQVSTPRYVPELVELARALDAGLDEQHKGLRALASVLVPPSLPLDRAFAGSEPLLLTGLLLAGRSRHRALEEVVTLYSSFDAEDRAGVLEKVQARAGRLPRSLWGAALESDDPVVLAVALGAKVEGDRRPEDLQRVMDLQLWTRRPAVRRLLMRWLADQQDPALDESVLLRLAEDDCPVTAAEALTGLVRRNRTLARTVALRILSREGTSPMLREVARRCLGEEERR